MGSIKKCLETNMMHKYGTYNQNSTMNMRLLNCSCSYTWFLVLLRIQRFGGEFPACSSGHCIGRGHCSGSLHCLTDHYRCLLLLPQQLWSDDVPLYQVLQEGVTLCQREGHGRGWKACSLFVLFFYQLFRLIILFNEIRCITQKKTSWRSV